MAMAEYEPLESRYERVKNRRFTEHALTFLGFRMQQFMMQCNQCIDDDDDDE